MGYIKEPKGVDFLVAPTVLTDADKQAIKNAIADHKRSEAISSQERIIYNKPVHSKTGKQVSR